MSFGNIKNARTKYNLCVQMPKFRPVAESLLKKLVEKMNHVCVSDFGSCSHKEENYFMYLHILSPLPLAPRKAAL